MPELDAFRKSAEITFDPHVFIRQGERHFDIDFVVLTVRTGSIVEEKSELPRKACFSRYHGKERKTYFVIVHIHQDFMEVKTVWLTKGR
ncbi:hypothetical protein C4580_02950 [Candidatus Woesearchaeota archaeon]|nr:MAG: hypothetical protein C4580_02950 [Candidatus Woesearchaeota archaeon]